VEAVEAKREQGIRGSLVTLAKALLRNRNDSLGGRMLDTDANVADAGIATALRTAIYVLTCDAREARAF
jgi:hypothetical protein